MNRLWKDNNKSTDGHLTLEESRAFIRDSFGSMANSSFSDKDIEEVFRKIDTDNDGKINKGEMARFLMQMTKY